MNIAINPASGTFHTFTFRGFYLKRIRRLYPALFAMLIATTAGVYIAYLPEDAASFGASLMATATYVSNIFFYTQSDYFNPQTHTSALLHTWSLSVEEQFYIVFPLVLFLIYKSSRNNLFLILSIIGVVSFVISEAVLRYDAAAAFFFSPTRFGQFIAGALVALAAAPKLSKMALEAISWLGLAMIGASIVFFSSKTPFPGLYSLIPTIGAAALIYAGQGQNLWSSRLLSLAPAQFFGKISYSLYLWHWPIIVLYKYHFASEILRWEKFGIFAVCVAAGYLSHRFIEAPGLKLDFKKPYFYKAAIATSLVGVVIGLSFTSTNGFADRFTLEQRRISEYLNYSQKDWQKECMLKSSRPSIDEFDVSKCMAVATDKPNILLMGDSHADHLADALKKTFPDAQLSQATASGCRPLLDTGGEPLCLKFREKLFTEFLPARQYDVVILSGRWKTEETSKLAKTIASIKPYAKQIVILGPVIEYSAALPRLMIFSLSKGDEGQSIQDARKYSKIAETDKAMRKASEKAGVTYFSPLEILCTKKRCITETQDGIPVQFDAAHLTREGAVILTNAMKSQGIITP